MESARLSDNNRNIGSVIRAPDKRDAELYQHIQGTTTSLVKIVGGEVLAHFCERAAPVRDGVLGALVHLRVSAYGRKGKKNKKAQSGKIT